MASSASRPVSCQAAPMVSAPASAAAAPTAAARALRSGPEATATPYSAETTSANAIVRVAASLPASAGRPVHR
jgi:hypothetical protein